MGKPKLSAKFKERTEKIEVKFGFKKALETSFTNEELQAILDGFEQFDDDTKYFPIKEEDNIVACLVRILTKEEDTGMSEAMENTRWIESAAKSKIPENLQQNTQWSCKCSAAPNNSLGLRLNDEQYGSLEYDTALLMIGILNKYWTKKTDTGKTKKVKGKDVPIYSYEVKFENPNLPGFYEKHRLDLIDFID